MRFVCGLALAALLGGIPASAQFSGRVSGTVVDTSGAAIPGADVELFVAGGKKAVLATKTGADGGYHLIGVRPADYDLAVSARASSPRPSAISPSTRPKKPTSPTSSSNSPRSHSRST
jgi:hypothetical protein